MYNKKKCYGLVKNARHMDVREICEPIYFFI